MIHGEIQQASALHSCNTVRMPSDALADPMSNLDQLYRQYEEVIELSNRSLPKAADYWAPAPPPLTLTGYNG